MINDPFEVTLYFQLRAIRKAADIFRRSRQILWRDKNDAKVLLFPLTRQRRGAAKTKHTKAENCGNPKPYFWQSHLRPPPILAARSAAAASSFKPTDRYKSLAFRK